MKKNQTEILKRIKAAAQKDAKKRTDVRFKKTMSFLVSKGLLKTNYSLPPYPTSKLFLKDAIWAGKNVEPRILEVLPAALVRLPNYFLLNDLEDQQTYQTAIRLLKEKPTPGQSLWGIPLEKMRPWFDLPLLDRRTKRPTEKKITRTYRLHPLAVEKLKAYAAQTAKTETEVLENFILKLPSLDC